MDKIITGLALYIKNDKGNLVDLGSMCAKDIYKILMKKKVNIPTTRMKWTQILGDCEEIHLAGYWKYWSSLPYRLTHEVRLQSFQLQNPSM